MPEWLAAWKDRAIGDAVRQARGDGGDDDPDIAGADSPNLERKRKWDALRSRLAYFRERGLLVAVDRVQRVYDVVAGALRTRLDGMCDDCRAAARDALESADALIAQEFSADGEFSDEEIEALEEDHAAGLDDENL